MAISNTDKTYINYELLIINSLNTNCCFRSDIFIDNLNGFTFFSSSMSSTASFVSVLASSDLELGRSVDEELSWEISIVSIKQNVLILLNISDTVYFSNWWYNRTRISIEIHMLINS